MYDSEIPLYEVKAKCSYQAEVFKRALSKALKCKINYLKKSQSKMGLVALTSGPDSSCTAWNRYLKIIKHCLRANINFTSPPFSMQVVLLDSSGSGSFVQDISFNYSVVCPSLVSFAPRKSLKGDQITRWTFATYVQWLKMRIKNVKIQ